MSEPTRFFFDRSDGLILEHEDGCWVAYDDYARLKAEVEKLRKGDERDMTAAYLYAAEQSKDEIKRLKAEVNLVGSDNAHLLKGIYSLSLNMGQLKDKVERLTKAGDAMAKEWVNCESLYHGNEDFIEAWNDAKSDNLNQPD